MYCRAVKGSAQAQPLIGLHSACQEVERIIPVPLGWFERRDSATACCVAMLTDVRAKTRLLNQIAPTIQLGETISGQVSPVATSYARN